MHMANGMTLTRFLADWQAQDIVHPPVAAALTAIANAGMIIAARIARGSLDENPAAKTGPSGGGDAQIAIDIWSNEILAEALRAAGVAAIASEELETPRHYAGGSGIVVSLDPLDGSSNVDTNVSIGTIFSILPALPDLDESFLQPGKNQLAAGYVIYGPQTSLVLTIGDGTQIFTLDAEAQGFILTNGDVRVPMKSNEYAINASNYRHWSDQIRAYIDDCISGTDGPREADVNMRWIASLVAECHRILMRGGVFLYPRDSRRGYEKGRLRLCYEANPIAFLIEQAGGKAFDGRMRIMDLVPTGIHQRVPLMMGSSEEIDRIARYTTDPGIVVARAPLFHRRGLFKS